MVNDGMLAVNGADICFLSAEEAIAAFKAKTLSPVDLMEAVIARAEAVNEKVNALTARYYDRAMAQAREAETRYVTRPDDVRPLEGIPCAIKDLHPVKGEITTLGSYIFRDNRPDHTLPTVQRLFDAGAIMHIRTTTPEFAHTGHCHSPLWGATRNPWNLQYSSGGSSGGAAVSVVLGMTTIAEGDDGGGSIRIPASACGIVGYKPPFGRNPATLLPTHIDPMIHLGPITRTVGDAALMQNVMSGPLATDITTLPRMQLPPRFEGIAGLRVALSVDLGYFEVDDEVRAHTLAAAEAFRELGCQVDEVDLGWDYGVYDAWMTHWDGLFASVAGQFLPRWQYEMDPFVRKILQRGMTHSFVRVKQTEFVRAEMYAKLGPMLQDYDILLCPTLAVPSVDAWHKCDDPDFTINGKHVDAALMWCLTYPFNLLGQLPAISVPSGIASTGVPTGLQIVGRPLDDLTVFRAAAAFEQARPWRHRRPGF
jgi:Asp-tRNA(Asn)/Glu-tRNA(Gln) amidotransferase A subunit family amidase